MFRAVAFLSLALCANTLFAQKLTPVQAPTQAPPVSIQQPTKEVPQLRLSAVEAPILQAAPTVAFRTALVPTTTFQTQFQPVTTLQPVSVPVTTLQPVSVPVSADPTLVAAGGCGRCRLLHRRGASVQKSVNVNVVRTRG